MNFRVVFFCPSFIREVFMKFFTLNKITRFRKVTKHPEGRLLMGIKENFSLYKYHIFSKRFVLKLGTLSMILIFVLVFLSGIGSSGEEEKSIRIAVATFSHETCTFCPGQTTVEDWEYYGPPTRDLFRSTSGYIGGFKRMCDEYGRIELVGILSPRGSRGGSSGSWITKEAFDKYSNLIVDDLKQAGRLDAHS